MLLTLTFTVLAQLLQTLSDTIIISAPNLLLYPKLPVLRIRLSITHRGRTTQYTLAIFLDSGIDRFQGLSTGSSRVCAPLTSELATSLVTEQLTRRQCIGVGSIVLQGYLRVLR